MSYNDKYPDMSAMYAVQFEYENKLKDKIKELETELERTHEAFETAVDGLLAVWRATEHTTKQGSIAYNVLNNSEDSEECVSDTWLRAWGAIPPNRPERLGAFLGKITRNLALDRLRSEKTVWMDLRTGVQLPSPPPLILTSRGKLY